MLVTYALLPILSAFPQGSGVEVVFRDILVAGRVLAQFTDGLPKHMQKCDGLQELGGLARPQKCIAEFESRGYHIPDYPEDSENHEEGRSRPSTLWSSAELWSSPA